VGVCLAASAVFAQVPSWPDLPLPPLVVTPPVPPKKETAPAPSRAEETPPSKPVEPPPVVITPVVEPPPAVIEPPPPPKMVEAKPASIVKTVPKPAIAEIVAAGPKAVDATASFATALAEAKAAHAKVRDYSGHIILQERVKGELQPEQTAEIRVRTSPKAVALKYQSPTSMIGRELIYADGRNANKARVKASGTFGPLAFASLPLTDSKALVLGTLTLNDISCAAVLERIEKALAVEAKMRNPVTVSAADYTFAKKTVTRYEIVFERSHGLRDGAKLVLCLDPDTKLPVRFEAHDTSLREAISFVNLSINQGVGDAPFER
jgi:hypothetical protein